ncbi:IS481 family transposase [Acetobacter senegalensis]|uniref:IS481 family transposase n=1 Tax=Acetobacter senegalensis TaxID=446692 RepID=UPI001EDBC43B|nr:IS481 family transposase [Acetobacter senegalensis]MCG4255125.1 IS481 family transposase [Acetobacter senegalensis]
MHQIHPQARTTPVVRAEIVRSTEGTSVLARRFGISDETVRKWRKRGVEGCTDRSSRPRSLAWKTTEEERAIVCHIRRATEFGLDDLTFVLRHFLPHLNRDSVWRILKAAGLNRRPPKAKIRPARGDGTFRDYDLGYVHIDVKHLPKLQTQDGEARKRFLYVAIDRCSRFVHLAVYDAENAANAVNFLTAVKAAFPFRVTHILTDRGSCFTADAFEKACQAQAIDRRRTRAYSPQTNGMVERFNGRVATEVLPINVAHHADLEILLLGFNQAYNHRRQRVLGGLSPTTKVTERLKQQPRLRNRSHQAGNMAGIMNEVDHVMIGANDVSQPDSSTTLAEDIVEGIPLGGDH